MMPINILMMNKVVASGWNISTASYDTVSADVSGQSGGTSCASFKPDGTKMYVIDRSTQRIYQYSLSTAWDLSTASYDSVSFTLIISSTFPTSVQFKSDGTKMYVIDRGNRTIFQHSLSTAWNISTASYDTVSLAIGSQESRPYDLFFKSDGTKMYAVGSSSGTVFQYSLSTAWDLSTASYDTVSFSVATQASIPTGLFFKSDGTKMYILGYGTSVFQYSLSTAWVVSSASYDTVSFSVATQSGDSIDLFFKSDGTKMYVADIGDQAVYQYSTS